jgi:hypothetical protein
MPRGPAGKNTFSVNKKIKFLLTFSPDFSKIENDIQTVRENKLFFGALSRERKQRTCRFK